MVNTSPESHNQTAQLSRFKRHFQFALLRAILNKSLQALKETPYGCEKAFFNTTDFHRFHVHLLKLISSQLIDQTDSDSSVNTTLFQFLNRNFSLDLFHEQKILMPKNSEMTSSMFSLKQNSINPLKLKFPKPIPC